MYIKRLLEAKIEQSLTTNKVLFILGARQVGKTTLLRHLLKTCTGEILNMDIEVDRARLRAAAKLPPREAVRSLGARTADDARAAKDKSQTRTDKPVLVIDEAHRIPNIGQITKGWYDADVPAKIILLGSSSTTLLKSAAAELAGRNEKLWLTPLLFQEMLAEQEWFNSDHAATAHRDFDDQIQALLLDQIIYGSYPEAYRTADPREYLTNLSSDYLLKDILAASLVRSPETVRQLLQLLATKIGQTVSISELATPLHISRQTAEKYLELLEAIFVIFPLPAYSTDPVKEINKGTKYYFWDTGIKNALQREWVVSPTRSDIKQLWENWVMAEVVKQNRTFNRHEDLFFWRSRNGSTVDLIVKKGSQLFAFDMSFEEKSKKAPSRSFKKTYDVTPQTIHRHNFLDFLL